MLAFKRAANIIRKQASEIDLSGAYERSKLREPSEIALADTLEATAARFEELWASDKFDELFGLLSELRPSVDAFFDNVMVMCEDEGLKKQRLNLLKSPC